MGVGGPHYERRNHSVTNEQEKAKVAALLEERRGYETRLARATSKDEKTTLEARIAAVDKSLRALGASGTAPANRAEKRVPTKKGKA